MRRHWKKFVIVYLVCEMLSLSLIWMEGRLARPWEGPWHAQVVDADTGQPLEGVVVLAWWTRYLSAAAYYAASQEVVTGVDGRFEIGRQWGIPLIPFFSGIDGPAWVIFKPGYGSWSFQGYQQEVVAKELDYWPRTVWIREKREQFRTEGVVIELPPLKTPEDWKKYRMLGTGPVPSERRQRLKRALDDERILRRNKL